MHALRTILVCALIIFGISSAHADNVESGPPLTGDMIRLKVLPKPMKLPEVLLAADGQGLAYLSQERGKLVILNVWATWCPPCIEELPSLNALSYAMDPNMVSIVTVSLDTAGNDKVKKFLEDNDMTKLPPYVEVNNSIQQLDVMRDVTGIPVTLIIDPQMRVIAYLPGSADWSGRSARAVIDYYIKSVSYVSVAL